MGSNFGVRRATLKPELEHGKQIWSQGWEHKAAPTSDLNDWGRHCGSQNVEFLWLQNSARSAARKLVTLLLLALRKLPRKRSQKRSRKSYALLANPVPCTCPNVPAARLELKART